MSLFAEGLAPPVTNTQVSNVWEEFARGYFAMYITGPWNIGEFRRRLPAELQDQWATAVLPRPAIERIQRFAGGRLRIGAVPPVAMQEATLGGSIEFLSEPAQQVRFYELTGNLPPRESSWRQGKLMDDPTDRRFSRTTWNTWCRSRAYRNGSRLRRRSSRRVKAAIAGRKTVDEALADLDRSVDKLLDKRRWMLARRKSDSN